MGNKSIMICGEKNTGKSFFCLFMINYLLSRFPGEKIIFLDTDLGQSMFNVPSAINMYIIGRKDIILTNLSEICFIDPILSYFIGEFTPYLFL